MKRIIDGYFNEITLLKVIATFCITWFHFKWTVPAQLSPLFIGGAIGNSLFFFASGFLLKFKDEQYPCEWLIKKFLRLLPSIWIFYMGARYSVQTICLLGITYCFQQLFGLLMPF